MKRSALIMVTLLAGAALMFAGCNNDPSSDSSSDSSSDTSSGTTKTVNVVEVAPWSLLSTKTILSNYSAKTDAKLKITFMGNEDANYSCAMLYTATDSSSIYNTKAQLVDYTVPSITKDAEGSVEYTLADLVTAMGTAEYLSYDAWGKISYVSSMVATYTEDSATKTVNLVEVAPWSLLSTKTMLSNYSAKTDAKLKITFMGNEDVNYSCPMLYTATDSSSIYSTSKALDDFKISSITKDAEGSVEYTLADLVTAMGTAEYLSYDAWGKISYISSMTVSYTE